VNEDDLGREYFDLFVGLGGGLLLPYASHYLTGARYGRPLAQLRETLRCLGIEKAAGIRSRRIMPRSFAKLWRLLSAAVSQLPTVLIVISSKDTSHRGSGAFLPIWSTLNQLTFTLASARLGELSWTLK